MHYALSAFIASNPVRELRRLEEAIEIRVIFFFQRAARFPAPIQLRCQAEVGDLREVVPHAEKNVRQLQVPVHDASSMQSLNAPRNVLDVATDSSLVHHVLGHVDRELLQSRGGQVHQQMDAFVGKVGIADLVDVFLIVLIELPLRVHRDG